MSRKSEAVDRLKQAPGSTESNSGGQGKGVSGERLFEGLILHGRIIGRRREKFIRKTTGEEGNKVTYSVDVGQNTIQVVHWDPKSYYAIEELVDIPVGVNAFARKGGGAAYSLAVRGSDQFGEAF